MPSPLQAEVAALLASVRTGDEEARGRLLLAVLPELRRIAGGLMHGERADHTLQPTALVHEAFLRLFQADFLNSANTGAHLFAAAARAMRQILVDHARGKETIKRGGDHRRVPLDDLLQHFEKQSGRILSLHAALEELAALAPRQAQVVELYFFGGHTIGQVADLLGQSVSTVEKDFQKARAYLHRRIQELD